MELLEMKNINPQKKYSLEGKPQHTNTSKENKEDLKRQ